MLTVEDMKALALIFIQITSYEAIMMKGRYQNLQLYQEVSIQPSDYYETLLKETKIMVNKVLIEFEGVTRIFTNDC